MIKPDKNINIGTFDIDIKEFAAHENAEYVAQQFQKALLEVINKQTDNNNTPPGLQVSQGGMATTSPAGNVPASFGGGTVSARVANATGGGSGGASSSGTSSGVTSTTPPATDVESKETTAIENIADDGSTTESSVQEPVVSTSDNEALIDAIREKYLKEGAADYKPERVKHWTGIISQIKNGADVKQLILLPKNEELKEIYQELLAKKKTSKTLTKEVLRAKMITEIESNILRDKTLDTKKKNYWETILYKLQNTEYTLQSILEQHQELFLFLDLFNIEYPTLSEDLLKIKKGKVYPKFKKIYPDNISKSTIYPELKKVKPAKDEDKGSTSGVITPNIKGPYLPNSKLTFKAKRKNPNLNWIIFNKDGTIFKEFVDIGRTFTYTFDQYGEFVVEAYLKTADYVLKNYEKARSGTRSYIAVHIKDPELGGIAVKGLKDKGHIVFDKEKEFVFKAIADVGAPKDIGTVTWEKFYKSTVAENDFTQIDKEVTVQGLSIQTKFDKAGCYKIVAKSGKQSFSTIFTVGGNYITKIKEKDKKSFVLFNKTDSLTFIPASYKLRKSAHIDKGSITWIVTKSGKPIGNVYKGEKFVVEQTKGIQEGKYEVTACVNDPVFGKKNASTTILVVQPQITEAKWQDNNGVIKISTGYKNEVNCIYAKIPYYNNAKATIKIYSGNKLLSTYNVVTDNFGAIKQEIRLEDFGIENLFNEKGKFENTEAGLLSFEIEAVGYKLKKSIVYLHNKIFVIRDEGINMAYFAYKGEVISPEKHAISYTTRFQAVVVASNMVGEKLALYFYHVKSKGFSSGISYMYKEVQIGNDGRGIVEFNISTDLMVLKDENKYLYFDIRRINDDRSKILKNSVIQRTYKQGDVLEAGMKVFSGGDHGDYHDPVINPQVRGWYNPQSTINKDSNIMGWNPYGSRKMDPKTNHLQDEKVKKYGKPQRGSGEHIGLDIYAPVGTPIYASVDGTITMHEFRRGDSGFKIKLEGKYKEQHIRFNYIHLMEFKEKQFRFHNFNGDGWLNYEDYSTPDEYDDPKITGESYMIHYTGSTLKIDSNVIDLSKARSIKRKSSVKKGQIIGYTGSTGNSHQGKKSNHLHYNVYIDWKSELPYKIFKEYIGFDPTGKKTSSKQDGETSSGKW